MQPPAYRVLWIEFGIEEAELSPFLFPSLFFSSFRPVNPEPWVYSVPTTTSPYICPVDGVAHRNIVGIQTLCSSFSTRFLVNKILWNPERRWKPQIQSSSISGSVCHFRVLFVFFKQHGWFRIQRLLAALARCLAGLWAEWFDRTDQFEVQERSISAIKNRDEPAGRDCMCGSMGDLDLTGGDREREALGDRSGGPDFVNDMETAASKSAKLQSLLKPVWKALNLIH